MSAAHDFQATILAALGYVPDTIEPGRFVRFATSNRRGDSAGWCKLFDDQRGGVFGCYRLGVSETWHAADRRTMTPTERAAFAREAAAAAAERDAQQREQWSDNARRIAKLWSECVRLVPGDPVTLYLKGRGLRGLWPLPECLRLHRGLGYWHGGELIGTYPAMVAPLTAPDGRIAALHRTYLTSDGRKAPVPTVKKLTGAAGLLAGACIALHKPERGRIGIAEGIETALAAWAGSGVPTVAAYCAGNVAAWQWPVGVDRLVIFADADDAGREAADALRLRAIASGLRCQVLAPQYERCDWLDVMASAEGVA